MRVIKILDASDAQEFLRKEANKALGQLLELDNNKKELRINLDFTFIKMENNK